MSIDKEFIQYCKDNGPPKFVKDEVVKVKNKLGVAVVVDVIAGKFGFVVKIAEIVDGDLVNVFVTEDCIEKANHP